MSLKEASKKLPRRRSRSTLRRWSDIGLKGVVLETELVGGQRFTSEEALERFLDQLQAMDV